MARSEMRGLCTDIRHPAKAEPLSAIIGEKEQQRATHAIPNKGGPGKLRVPNLEPPPRHVVFVIIFIEQTHESPLDVLERVAHILVRLQAPRLWQRRSPHHLMERRRVRWDRLLPLSQADGLAKVLEELISGVRAAVAV